MRIGLIQTRGIGDVVIALPIAQAFIKAGHSVHWPVDARFEAFLRRAAPGVDFVPIAPEADASPAEAMRYFIDGPAEELRRRECERVIVLYNKLELRGGVVPPNTVQRPDIAPFLSFDQYKYAVAGVPFSEKWNLRIERDPAREEKLLGSLRLTRPHICLHLKGSNTERRMKIPPAWKARYDLVFIDQRTDSPFDWLLTLEKAAIVVCIDSVFANLVDQLGLPMEKHLILVTPSPFTPILRGGWSFSTSL